MYVMLGGFQSHELESDHESRNNELDLEASGPRQEVIQIARILEDYLIQTAGKRVKSSLRLLN